MINITNIFTLLLIIGAVVSSYISANYALGFGLTGLLGLYDVLLIVVIFVFFGVGLKKRKKNFLLAAGVLLAVFLVANYCTRVQSRKLHAYSRLHGDRIVAAVEQFRSEKGRLPETLDEVVPDYLSEIPDPGFKYSRYIYHLNTIEGQFWVGYPAPAWLVCQKSPTEEWYCDD